MLRISVRETKRAFRYATSSLRCLPDYVIIGAQKAGTTSLHNYLAQHPSILRGFPSKELHFFDRFYSLGEKWYRTSFPIRIYRDELERRVGERVFVGETTPNYMFHPKAPQRMAELLPDARLIVILRNPVERAISHLLPSSASRS